jgi:hypothetical protein
MSNSGVSLIGAVCLTSVLLAQSRPAAPDALVPDLVRVRCVTCHGADMIQQQRLMRGGWEREVDKMVRWGAVVADAERAQLLNDLTTGAATSTAPSRVANSRGSDVLARQCTGCHALDLVEQQRLGRAAWGREVDKMLGWGARIAAEDRGPLVEYLVGRFGA